MCVCVTTVYCLMLLAHLLLRKSVRLTCLSNKYFFTSIMVVFFLPTICGHCCPVSSTELVFSGGQLETESSLQELTKPLVKT